MTIRFLALLFFLLLMGDVLGIGFSLAPGLSLKNSLLYLAFLAIAIDTAVAKNRRPELASVLAPFTLLLLYAVLTWLVLALGIDRPGYLALNAFMALKTQIIDQFVIFLLFYYGALKAEDARWLMKAMIWIIILSSAVSVLDGLGLLDLGLVEEDTSGRLGGVVGLPNHFGALLALFLPAMLALAFMERGWRRVLALTGFTVSGMALLMTGSRSAMLSVVVGTLLVVVTLRRYFSARLLAAAFVGVFLLGVCSVLLIQFTVFGEVLYERLFDRTLAAGDLRAVSAGRTAFWVDALVEMMRAPWSMVAGFGWDAWSHFPGFYWAPHNLYLKMFFELGIVGLFIYVLIHFNVIRIARRALGDGTSQSFPLLLAFITGYASLLFAFFFINLYATALFIWAFAGAAMRLAVSERAE